jgi:XTP/dITP diphosphohydrolase
VSLFKTTSIFMRRGMRLIIATNNVHKVEEIRHALHERLKLITLKELGFSGDIPESESTLEGNAILKARYIYDRYKISCFADDTGLEIEALNGEPGVFSARYAGEDCCFDNNINKVLAALQDVKNRSARFRTVIALIISGKLLIFEGIVNGVICDRRRGEKGFGYDPIFQPEGLNKTFAEITLEEKNKISHRAIAIRKLADYLETIP